MTVADGAHRAPLQRPRAARRAGFSFLVGRASSRAAELATSGSRGRSPHRHFTDFSLGFGGFSA